MQITKNRTTFGALLSNFRFARQQAREKVNNNLWSRNKLDNPTKRDGYRIEQSEIIDREGNTVINGKLWQLVDQETIKVSSNTNTEVLEPEAEPEISDLLK